MGLANRIAGILGALLMVGCTVTAPTSPPPSASTQTGAPQDPAASASGEDSPPADGSPAASAEPATPVPATPAPATPAPSRWTSDADTLAWHRIGTIPADISGAVAFRGGYIALTAAGRAVYVSSDGRAWRRVKLPLDPPGDAGVGTDGNGRIGRAIASNGDEVLVVGGYAHEPCESEGGASTGSGPECVISPVTWRTADGTTWKVAFPALPADELVAAWAVEGGWEAAGSSWSGVSLGGRNLWTSTDGRAWSRLTPRPPAAWEGYDPDVPVGLSDVNGTTVLAASERSDSLETTVAVRTGSEAWRVLDAFPGDGAQVITGIAPQGPSGRWVLAGFTYDESGCDPSVDGDFCGTETPTTWSSTDGATWTVSTLTASAPVPPTEDDELPLAVTAVQDMVASERGYVAVGTAEAWWQGARHDTWISDDGVAWTRLRQRDMPDFDYGPGVIAAGPAGVLGFSGSGKEGDSSVWELR